jgi:hypothetical protein
MIGEPELTEKEEQEKDNITKKKLTEILIYCKENKQQIIDLLCKTNSIVVPDLFKIKSFGGDFLDLVKSFDYQKNKIVSKNNNINSFIYNLFKAQNLLNPKIIRLKNQKDKSKRFNL